MSEQLGIAIEAAYADLPMPAINIDVKRWWVSRRAMWSCAIAICLGAAIYATGWDASPATLLAIIGICLGVISIDRSRLAGMAEQPSQASCADVGVDAKSSH
jgi:hypothetical protein